MSFWSDPGGAISDFVANPSKATTNALAPVTGAFDDVLKNGVNAKPSNLFIVAGDPLGSDVKKLEANDPVAGAIGAGIASYFTLGIGGNLVAEGNRRERGDEKPRDTDLMGGAVGGALGAIYGENSIPFLSKAAPLANLFKPKPSSGGSGGQSSDNYYSFGSDPSINYSASEKDAKEIPTASDVGSLVSVKAQDSTLTIIVSVLTIIAILYQMKEKK